MSITQMSRLNMVQLCQSDVQGINPNHRHQQDQYELDFDNYVSLLSHSFNIQQNNKK